jgi:hypothetical protein
LEDPCPGFADRHTRHFVLGDDAPVYESETMSQARGGVSTTDKTGPAPRKPPTPTSAATRSGPSAIMFGNSTPEYTTTTGSSMVNYNVSAPQRQTKPAQAAIVFGDDSVDFVSNRMAEEGLMSRKLGQRYDPKATVGGDKTGAPVRASVDKPALAGVSWKLGTDEWKPQTSAAADFAWPTMESTSGPRQSRVVVRSNIHLGDDGSAFVTEAKGSYSQPDATLGGRQPSARPLGGGAIVFGSDSVSYKSAAAAAHGDVHMDGSATVERLAAMQRQYFAMLRVLFTSFWECDSLLRRVGDCVEQAACKRTLCLEMIRLRGSPLHNRPQRVTWILLAPWLPVRD